MKDRLHPACLHDTASLIAAAEQRRQQGDESVSLVSCLLDEVFTTLSAKFVHVWEIVADAEPKLLWRRGQEEITPDHATQAVSGVVKCVSKKSSGTASSSTIRNSSPTSHDVT